MVFVKKVMPVLFYQAEWYILKLLLKYNCQKCKAITPDAIITQSSYFWVDIDKHGSLKPKNLTTPFTPRKGEILKRVKLQSYNWNCILDI